MPISFSPTHSFVDSSFFTQLSELKLDVLKLDASAVPVFGSSNYSSVGPNQPPSIGLDSSSFKTRTEFESLLPQNSSFVSPGSLYNVNTLEEFKKTDKKQLLHDAGDRIYQAIVSKRALEDPALLSQFAVLSFADLKKYRFYYWCAFPLLHVDWEASSLAAMDPDTASQIERLLIEDEFRAQVGVLADDSIKPIGSVDLDEPNGYEYVFLDTSTQPESASYVLRNFLAALAIYGATDATVHVYRTSRPSTNYTIHAACTSETVAAASAACPKVSGWERTSQGRLGPKLADLGSLIDPVQLADQATDLNLKLMRWRIAPKLDLDVARNTKCLLLGSGTLGSYVGRALLAWGVRKITFVDNGKVSFSNPVRQPLYTFDDCLDGGHKKAETAAAALKKIFPKVDAQGFSLEVPMAGHPVTNEAREKRDFDKLCKLFDEHDAVFILMDSRETRWLPTVLGNAKSKIVMNAALGFESYLVLRHGCIDPAVPIADQDEGRLGCYFCNDVYAPSDSLTDRTLDQMCTVTRPGVAMMASALVVEMFISILQSPRKQFTPHSLDNQDTVLGCMPHQIRGFLHNFEQLKLHARNFQYCSACSAKVVEEFNSDGWEFVKRALNNPKYLEDLVGLTKIHEDAEKAALEIDAEIDSEDEIV